MKFDKE